MIQRRQQRGRRRTRNRRRVRGIGDNDKGSGGSTTGPRNLRQQRSCRRRNMGTNTSTGTTEALAEDRQTIQGIRDDDGGGSGSTTGPMDRQRRQSVNFTCYSVASSNTVSSLSCCCLIWILFSSYLFLFTGRKTIYTASMRQICLYKVYTNLAYVPPMYRRVKRFTSYHNQ